MTATAVPETIIGWKVTARPWVMAAVVFAVVFVVLMAVQGNLFVASSDEGLVVEGAERLLDGQRPYVDFVGHASPGAYLYQAAVFRLLGRSLWTSRVLAIFYQCLQVALLFWMVWRLAGPRAALCAAWVYTAIETADTVQLTAHHRWDSSTLGLVSIALALAGGGAGRWWWAFAGLAAGAAIAATPTAGLFVIVTVAWLLWTRRAGLVVAYLSGVAAPVLAVFGWMASTGMLPGYLGFLQFMKVHYAAANTTPYGYLGSGWLRLLDLGDPNVAGLLVRGPIVLCLALPALAPVVALISWGWWRRDLPVARETACYLIACQVAMIVYSVPRLDVSHLAYTSAFAVALVAVWMAWKLPAKVSAIAGVFFVFWSLAFVYQRANVLMGARTVETPVGHVLVAAGHQADIGTLLAHVHEGETLVVYPFMPSLGFLTGARNPTMSMFMQPGMMEDREEGLFLGGLERTRPRWILWFRSTREQYLQAFPSAAGLAYHFPRTEAWIEANYTLRSKLPALTYDLWELTSARLP